MTKARDLSIGIPGGLVLITPTGATGGTVNPSGTVTIGNAVTSVTVSGAFSATYDNYLVTVAGGVASAGLDMQIQLGGITTLVYYTNMQYNSYGATAPLAASNNNTVWSWCGNASPSNLTSRVEIASPFLSKSKSFTSRFISLVSNGIAGTSQGFCDSTLSATSFTLSVSGGTVTGGTIAVYGYRK